MACLVDCGFSLSLWGDKRGWIYLFFLFRFQFLFLFVSVYFVVLILSFEPFLSLSLSLSLSLHSFSLSLILTAQSPTLDALLALFTASPDSVLEDDFRRDARSVVSRWPVRAGVMQALTAAAAAGAPRFFGWGGQDYLGVRFFGISDCFVHQLPPLEQQK